LGFSALAGCHLAAALYSWGKSDEQSLSAGFEAATRAVELDNRDATANTSLGLANLYSRRHREAIRRFEKAIELNPNHAHAHALLGWGLACIGNSEHAISSVEEALRLSPRDREKAGWFALASFAAFASGDYDEGIEWARRCEGENLDWPGVYRVLAANCGQAGRIEEGRAAVAELRRVAPEMTIESTRAQVPWKDPADMERYLDGLRKAGLPQR